MWRMPPDFCAAAGAAVSNESTMATKMAEPQRGTFDFRLIRASFFQRRELTAAGARAVKQWIDAVEAPAATECAKFTHGLHALIALNRAAGRNAGGGPADCQFSDQPGFAPCCRFWLF